MRLFAPRQAYTKRLIAAAPGLAHGGRVVPRFDAREQAQPEPILTLTGVSKTSGTHEPRRGQRGFNALDDISVTVPRGRTNALVGESGCGKTTTLRIALGLESATSDLERRTHGPAASRPTGAMASTLSAELPPGIVMSPVYHGDPDQVVDAVLADPGLSVADEVVVFLPPAFGLAENVRPLGDLARTVAPALGWAAADPSNVDSQNADSQEPG